MRWPPRRSPTTARTRRVASQERAVPFIITVVAVVAVFTLGLLVPARPAGGRRGIIALGRRRPGAEHRRLRRAAGVVLGVACGRWPAGWRSFRWRCGAPFAPVDELVVHGATGGPVGHGQGVKHGDNLSLNFWIGQVGGLRGSCERAQRRYAFLGQGRQAGTRCCACAVRSPWLDPLPGQEVSRASATRGWETAERGGRSLS